VLIRALEPTRGLALMRVRRGVDDVHALCSGPGKLTQALGITGEHDGLALDRPPFELLSRTTAVAVVRGTRIGISKAMDQPWRYGLADSAFVSRRFRP